MGGSRPMTVGRAVSLGALIAVVLGVATGLSHIGHTSVSPCQNRPWWVVLGTPADRPSTSTENSRAVDLVATDCTGATSNPKGGFIAFARFATQAEAEMYEQQLVAAGYARLYGFQPYVEPAPVTTSPTP